MKTIALLPSHPKQVWMLRALELACVREDYCFIWIIRDKDISGKLAKELGIKFTSLSKASNGIIGNAFEMAKNIPKAIYLTKKLNIDLWITKYGAGNIAAKLLRKKNISFGDDDVDIIPLVALTSFRFADKILAPSVTKLGRYKYKSITSMSAQEQLYLQPDRYSQNFNAHELLGLVSQRKFGIIRLVSLTAHHDVGKKGISSTLLSEIIQKLSDYDIKVFITSEEKLPSHLSRYELNIEVHKIHAVLASAEIYVGDSLSMSTEAALLGVPSIRVSDFTNENSMLSWVESFGLVKGFKPSEGNAIIQAISSSLERNNRDKLIKKFYNTVEDPMNSWMEAVKCILKNS